MNICDDEPDEPVVEVTGDYRPNKFVSFTFLISFIAIVASVVALARY